MEMNSPRRYAWSECPTLAAASRQQAVHHILITIDTRTSDNRPTATIIAVHYHHLRLRQETLTDDPLRVCAAESPPRRPSPPSAASTERIRIQRHHLFHPPAVTRHQHQTQRYQERRTPLSKFCPRRQAHLLVCRAMSDTSEIPTSTSVRLMAQSSMKAFPVAVVVHRLCQVLSLLEEGSRRSRDQLPPWSLAG